MGIARPSSPLLEWTDPFPRVTTVSRTGRPVRTRHEISSLRLRDWQKSPRRLQCRAFPVPGGLAAENLHRSLGRLVGVMSVS